MWTDTHPNDGPRAEAHHQDVEARLVHATMADGQESGAKVADGGEAEGPEEREKDVNS